MQSYSPFTLPKSTLAENRIIKKTIPYFAQTLYGRYNQPYVFSPTFSDGDIETYLAKKHKIFTTALFHANSSFIFWNEISTPSKNHLIRYELMRCYPFTSRAIQDANIEELDVTSVVNESISYYTNMQAYYNSQTGLENGYPDKPIPNIDIAQINKIAKSSYHKINLEFLADLNAPEEYADQFIYIDLRNIRNQFNFKIKSEVISYLVELIDIADHYCIIGAADNYLVDSLNINNTLKISSKNLLFMSDSVMSLYM